MDANQGAAKNPFFYIKSYLTSKTAICKTSFKKRKGVDAEGWGARGQGTW